jgi:hypothetical protein
MYTLSTVLYTVLNCSGLYLHCTELYCTVLYCIALYCIAPYCDILLVLFYCTFFVHCSQITTICWWWWPQIKNFLYKPFLKILIHRSLKSEKLFRMFKYSGQKSFIKQFMMTGVLLKNLSFCVNLINAMATKSYIVYCSYFQKLHFFALKNDKIPVI